MSYAAASEDRPNPPHFSSHARLRCPNCGRHEPVYDPQAIYFACPACGLISDVTAAQALPVVRSHNPTEIPVQEQPLDLEQEIVLGERLYVIVGRHFQFVRYQIPVSDPEREYSVYDSELTEWPLVDRHGRVAYLQIGPHGHYLLRPVTPEHWAVPQGWQMMDFFNGELRGMTQRGLLETGFLEGEIRYAFAHQGDAFEFACYRAPNAGQAQSPSTYWLKFRRGGANRAFEYSLALEAFAITHQDVREGLQRVQEGAIPAPQSENPPKRKGDAGFLKRLLGRSSGK